MPERIPGPARYRTRRTFSLCNLKNKLRFLGAKIVAINPSYIMVEFEDGKKRVDSLESFVNKFERKAVVDEAFSCLPTINTEQTMDEK